MFIHNCDMVWGIFVFIVVVGYFDKGLFLFGIGVVCEMN